MDKKQDNQDHKDRKMPKTLHPLSQVSNDFQFFQGTTTHLID